MPFPRAAPFRVSVLAAALFAAGCATVPRDHAEANRSSDTAAIAAAAAQAATREVTNAPASAPGGARSPDRSTTAAAAAASAAAQAAQSQKPFNDVVRDAKELPGLFNVWQREDRTWIEIAPE